MIKRYLTKDFETLWSPVKQFQTWLIVELVACRAMEEAGKVPAGTTEYLEGQGLHARIDPDRIDEIERTTRHDVIAFLTHLEELAGEKVRWLHYGMTSSDVVDTSTALLLTEAADSIYARLQGFIRAVASLAKEHAGTIMMGRTHGMYAEPTTFGFVMSGHLEEARRNLRRLNAAREGIRFGKLSGAVGNYAHNGPSIEARTMELLGLRAEPVATQVVPRDRHAELMATLASIGSGIERLTVNVRHLARTEVGEVREEFGKGQKGSSAMPHKRNPIASENLCGIARLLRGYAVTALENVVLWHERDISHSSAERAVFPDATSIAAYMLDRATALVRGLVVDRGRMEANVAAAKGLYFSESVLLELAKAGTPRQEAYTWVQECAMRTLNNGTPFKQCLSEHVEIGCKLTDDQISKCCDTDRYVLNAEKSVWRSVASSE